LRRATTCAIFWPALDADIIVRNSSERAITEINPTITFFRKAVRAQRLPLIDHPPVPADGPCTYVHNGVLHRFHFPLSLRLFQLLALAVALRISTSLLRHPLLEADTTIHKVIIFILAITGFSLFMDISYAYPVLLYNEEWKPSFRFVFSDLIFGFLFFVSTATSSVLAKRFQTQFRFVIEKKREKPTEAEASVINVEDAPSPSKNSLKAAIKYLVEGAQ